MNRPTPPCAICRAPVDRLQQSAGVIAAYPCGCWHTPAQARQVANAAHRAARQAQP